MPISLLGISRASDVVRLPQEGPFRRSAMEDGSAEPSVRSYRWVLQGPLTAATVWPFPAPFGPLEHARLLAAIHKQVTVLPVRHGTVLPNEEAVRQMLANRCATLCTDLDRLEGMVEIGLRVTFPHSPLPAGPPAASGPGHADISPTEYLSARRAQYRRRDQLDARAQLAVATCLQAVNGLYRSWRRLSPELLGIVRLAFLVERRLSEAFAERAAMLRSTTIDQACQIVGPWPPYSFA